MKNNIILILLSALILSSCIKDSTGDVSKVTNYPIITLNGDDEVFVHGGTTYNDLGAISTEGGNQITTVTNFSDGVYWENAGVDTSSPDKYIVNYSATNADGFDGNASRIVWVAYTGNFINSIEGLYKANVQRAPAYATTAQYSNMRYVIIKKIGTDSYEISDAAGGYYDIGRAYGAQYAARGTIINVSDYSNSIVTSTQSVIPGFGNTVNLTNFVINPVDKKITFTANGNFANGTFKVQLTQVQF